MGFDLNSAKERTASEETETPAPSRHPSFGGNMIPTNFRNACEEYSEWAIENYEVLKVDLSSVTIEVSEQMVRTAGKAGKKRSAPTDYFMRIAYDAYLKWGWSEKIQSTIRHELIHLRQYQETGDGDHGEGFKRMAKKVDTSVHCQKFTEYNYGVFCSVCDQMVAGKYRECKMIKQPERYRSKCCDGKCYSEKLQ